MKKILLIIFLCLFSVSLNAKTIYTKKGDNLLKFCKIKETKEKFDTIITDSGKQTLYNYYLIINAKIGGKLVNINDEPIINKKIYVSINGGETATIYSNENGIFSYEINDKVKVHINLLDKLKAQAVSDKLKAHINSLEILLEFNDKNKYFLTATFENGNDVSVTNPYEIHIKSDKEYEHSLYLSNNGINENIVTRKNNKDIIILSSQTFSAQYYRDKISIIDQSNEMFKNADLDFPISNIEPLILDENKNIKANWKDIVKKEIIIQQANEMLKKADLKIAVETIILDKNKNIKTNWKELVRQEIIKEKDRLNRIEKRKRRIIEDPDSCNLTYKNEKEIFDAIGFNEYDLSVNLERAFKPLFYVESGTWIAVPVQVFQILGNNQFLFKYGENNYGPTLFHGNLKKCCRKDVFYAGQWVDVVGVINGTSSYVTFFGETKTIPKVKVYAIRPSVAMQNRYY